MLPKEPVKTLIKLAYIIIAILAVYFVLPKIVTYLFPFLLAYVITIIINPIISFLHNKLKIPRRIAVVMTMLIVIAIIGTLLFTLVYRVVIELQNLAYQIPAMLNGDIDYPDWINNFTVYYDSLPPTLRSFLDTIGDNIKNNLSEIIKPATNVTLSFATGIAKSFPSMLIFTVVLILATYFISNDKVKIKQNIVKILPYHVVYKCIYLKKALKTACGGYFKAQLILMGFTFLILFIGFSILDFETAVLTALVVSVFDALPMLGTGIFLNSWAVVCLFRGQYREAVGLFIIYLIAALIRQLLEPKIVGKQIGLHPLITLGAMYIGLKSMGVIGMILGPIIAIIAINLYKANNEYQEKLESGRKAVINEQGKDTDS